MEKGFVARCTLFLALAATGCASSAPNEPSQYTYVTDPDDVSPKEAFVPGTTAADESSNPDDVASPPTPVPSPGEVWFRETLRGFPISLQGMANLCLATSGDAVNLVACAGIPQQTWMLNSGHLVSHDDTCLTAASVTPTATTVSMQPCSHAAATQFWSFGRGIIFLSGTQRCLRTTSAAPGAPLVLGTCAADSLNAWTVAENNRLWVFAGADPRLCLDAAAGTVRLRPCAPTPPATWSVTPLQMQSAAGCLDTQGRATAVGTAMVMAPCVANAPSQTWYPSGGGLRLTPSGGCAGMAQLAADAGLRITTCDQRNDLQRWIMAYPAE